MTVKSAPRSTELKEIGGNASTDFSLRVFLGHHKCATGWIDEILMEVCFHMGICFKIVHQPRDFEAYGTLSNLVNRLGIDFLAYTNARREHARDLHLHKGFHVVRDPRDVVVSAYYSHLFSHETKAWPVLQSHRDELRKMDKAEGLFREMDFSRSEFEDMHAWNYDQANILEMKMEELTRRPLYGFRRILRFLEMIDEDDASPVESWARRVTTKMNRLNERGRRLMPARLPMFPVPRRRIRRLPSRTLSDILDKKSFKKLSGGRRRGQENVRSHYRKGVPGDWRNHFQDEHIRLFKERHGDLLIKLGYESDLDW